MTDSDIVNLIVNWLNYIGFPCDKSRIAPAMLGFTLCKYLKEKECFKDILPNELFERLDLEEALEKDVKELNNLIETLNQCCCNGLNSKIKDD